MFSRNSVVRFPSCMFELHVFLTLEAEIREKGGLAIFR